MIILGLLVSLVVLVLPIVLIVRALSGRGEEAGWSLRRLLQYAFLLASVVITALGVSGLLEAALPVEQRFVSDEASRLARSLAFTLVGIPATWLLWRLVDRRLREDPDERRAVPWPLYLAFAMTAALITAYVGWVSVGEWALGAGELEQDALSRAVVWTLVWAAHWSLLTGSRAPLGKAALLPDLAGSATGLFGMAGGVAAVLFRALDAAYDALAGTELVAGTGGDVRQGLAISALGAVIWWWHWLRRAVRSHRDVLWYGYVELFGALSGLLAALGGAGTLLYQVLLLTFGVSGSRAGGALEQIPGALTALLVGTAVWIYHRSVLGVPGDRRPYEPERAYDYLVAAVGLLAAATGVTIALVAGLEAIAPRPITRGTGLITLSAAISTLAVGTPLWWVIWRRIQGRTQADPGMERRSPSRRIYLMALFGVLGLTALISLITILFVLFRALLEGELAAGVIHDFRIPVALVLTAGAVSAYHWLIYRQDREALGPEEEGVGRAVLLVTTDGELADGLRARTGATVRTWRHADAGPPSEGALERIAEAVLASPHRRLLVLADEIGERVIPYEQD